MNADKTGTQKKKSSSNLTLSLVGAAGFLVIILLITYLANLLKSIETLEGQLQYQTPELYQPNAGSYSILLVDAQTVYVPAYSHIYARGGTAHLLETTLSIRNTDPENSILINSVDYYDSQGKLVKKYLERAVKLAPMQTTAYLVKKQDTRGGSGANFIVTWSAEKAVYEPIIEAVMVGASNNQPISFISHGRPLAKRLGQ
jgi:hypothetical protein